MTTEDRSELREFNILLIKALSAAYKASSTNDLDVLFEGVKAANVQLLDHRLQAFADKVKDKQFHGSFCIDDDCEDEGHGYQAIMVDDLDQLLQEEGLKG